MTEHYRFEHGDIGEHGSVEGALPDMLRSAFCYDTPAWVWKLCSKINGRRSVEARMEALAVLQRHTHPDLMWIIPDGSAWGESLMLVRRESLTWDYIDDVNYYNMGAVNEAAALREGRRMLENFARYGATEGIVRPSYNGEWCHYNDTTITLSD